MIPIPDNDKSITRKFILALPQRRWDLVSEYDYLYIVPTNHKHDSGYGLIAIVGVVNKQAEIAAICDDIGWTFPIKHPYKMDDKRNHMILRTDCLFPSKILRMWASGEHYFKGKFRVGVNVSSTDVELFLVPVGVNQMTGKALEI